MMMMLLMCDRVTIDVCALIIQLAHEHNTTHSCATYTAIYIYCAVVTHKIQILLYSVESLNNMSPLGHYDCVQMATSSSLINFGTQSSV